MPPVAPLGGDLRTCAFSQRPLPDVYRPFMEPNFKARSGSRAVGRGAISDRLQRCRVSDTGPCGRVVRDRGRRSKASQEGNRGQKRALFRSGGIYGDLRIADGAFLSRRWRVATVLATRAKREGAFGRGNGGAWRGRGDRRRTGGFVRTSASCSGAVEAGQSKVMV